MKGIDSGTLYIVAAPSGGGKTSLVRQLVKSIDSIEISISHTTRPMRPGEQHGVDYFFVKESEFLDMVNANAFIEHARVFDNFYGTSVDQISKRLEQGIDVVLDIDWQGAEQIRRLFNDVISIFIIPPSLEALEHRLTYRSQDDARVIHERMIKAQDEISHFAEFDYLIVNDEFDKAALELKSIVVANRLAIRRQVKKLSKFLSFLMSS